MVEIIFKNKTNRIEACEVIIEGKKFTFKGEKAREIASMANNDYPSIKTFVENLMLN